MNLAASGDGTGAGHAVLSLKGREALLTSVTMTGSALNIGKGIVMDVASVVMDY